MKILISGGTGFLGTYLTQSFLEKDHEVFILTRRDITSARKNLYYIKWDGINVPSDFKEDIDVVINLAGEDILNKWWTEKQKRIILNSRLNATSGCVNFINNTPSVRRFFSASAVAYYGVYPDKKHVFTESSPVGKGFLSHVAYQWESVAMRSKVSPVLMRFGIVLAKDAKAFKLMYKNFLKYAAGYLKPGAQGFPWIHIQDVVGAINTLIEKEETGPLNFVAPELISNYEFAKTLATYVNKKTLFPVPELVARTILGSERSKVLTRGQYVVPERLSANYDFLYPTVKSALDEILKK